jgi:hypothetical protein
MLTILFVLLAGLVGASEKYVGQVRVMNRPEGAVVAVDTTGDGLIDQLFIVAPVKIAGAFSGPATIELGDTYLHVIPADDTPGFQYVVGKDAPTFPSQRGYRGLPVHGIVHYSGKVVAYPLAELGTLPVPRLPEEGMGEKPVSLAAIPSFGDDHGLYVGQIRIIPRAGHFLIAVDKPGP